MTRSLAPVLAVTAVLMALWYAAVIPMNAQWERDQAARGGYTLSLAELAARTMAQDRPRLPAPHQVAVELWNTTFGCGALSPRACRATTPPEDAGLAERLAFARERLVASATSNRSLIWHGWITLSATALGFAIGAGLGFLLAIGIVHNRAMDASVMPFAIASQTIPIIALAPMIVVVLASVGLTGLIPKSVIAAYLSFFPVVVGMVKGLRAPDAMQLDQMKTWNASAAQTFWRLRLPASMPYLFASVKVAVAAALVGTIVGELPVQQGGLGTRLLAGSYFGQTLQIWSALLAAAILAGVLVAAVGLVERVVLRRMGFAR
jgi:NitT/TauT family transport system permease protein